jgi:exodeoxyribonuclease VIII
MLDLETLGTGPESVIIAIGAVKFDPATKIITDVFYEVVDRESSVAIGLKIDQATVDWWAKQSTEARAAFNEPGKPIVGTLMKFKDQFANQNSVVWGCGSDFDNVIMGSAYRLSGIEQPWKFWNNRCYRTMKSMYPSVVMKRSGTHHNAVDDAISQANHLMDILAHMRGE